MMILTFDPLEIDSYSFKNSRCFAFTKTPSDPFGWVKVLFLRIAGFARWHNIVSRVGSVHRDRDEVLLNKHSRLLQRRWTITAISTDYMPVFQTALPFSLRESRWKQALPSVAKLNLCAGLLGVIFSVSTFDLFAFVGIILLPATDGGIRFTRVRFIPSRSACFDTVGMIICPLLVLLMSAIQAVFFNAKRLPFVFHKIGTWLPVITFAANAPDGEWFVDHLAPRNAISYGEVGQSGTSAASSGATLDQFHCTPEWSMAQ